MLLLLLSSSSTTSSSSTLFIKRSISRFGIGVGGVGGVGSSTFKRFSEFLPVNFNHRSNVRTKPNKTFIKMNHHHDHHYDYHPILYLKSSYSNDATTTSQVFSNLNLKSNEKNHQDHIHDVKVETSSEKNHQHDPSSSSSSSSSSIFFTKKLLKTYQKILKVLDQIPEKAIYRQSIETSTLKRYEIVLKYDEKLLKMVDHDHDDDRLDEQVIKEMDRIKGAVEKELEVEFIQEAIDQAEDEYLLALKLLESQAWNDLEEKPAPGQWEYFTVPCSTSYPKD